MTDRGRIPVIRDPANAAAAAKCWLGRTKGPLGLGAFHPEECDFCHEEPAILIRALHEFADWSGLNWRSERYDPAAPNWTQLRPEIAEFTRLPREQQAKLVGQSQGYIPEDDD